MSRHNRRRNRGSRNQSENPFRQTVPSLPSVVPFTASPPSTSSAYRPRTSRNDVSARHWHNRYAAWQTRERRQSEERLALDALQRRIFGGEKGEGDEDGLCLRMAEYFGSLDFIDNPACHYPGLSDSLIT